MKPSALSVADKTRRASSLYFSEATSLAISASQIEIDTISKEIKILESSEFTKGCVRKHHSGVPECHSISIQHSSETRTERRHPSDASERSQSIDETILISTHHSICFRLNFRVSSFARTVILAPNARCSFAHRVEIRRSKKYFANSARILSLILSQPVSLFFVSARKVVCVRHIFY